MNKISGNISDFALLREDASRIVISYGLTVVSEEMYEWYEVYLYKNAISQLTLKDVKDAIDDDIDARTDAAILCGYDWTVKHGDDAGKEVKVWLSKENQNNFKAKHDAALVYPNLVRFPMTYKISEDTEKNAIYEVFENIEELATFYLGGIDYIQSCYEAGWAEKGGIDWQPYEEALENLTPEVVPEPTPEPEPEPEPEEEEGQQDEQPEESQDETPSEEPAENGEVTEGASEEPEEENPSEENGEQTGDEPNNEES